MGEGLSIQSNILQKTDFFDSLRGAAKAAPLLFWKQVYQDRSDTTFFIHFLLRKCRVAITSFTASSAYIMR